MPDLIFKDQEMTQLVTFVNDNVPTKYGKPMIDFIDEVVARRKTEAEAAKAAEDEKKVGEVPAK